MIAYVRGTLVEKDPTRVVVEAAGVGYELFIPLSTYERLPREGEEVRLSAHHAVREDDETLYGFATAAERTFFAKLVQVSGVGPKIALAILSGGTVGELALAIASRNVQRLASVKGVGKKTAEKICVELRDKVNAIEALSSAQAGGKGMNAPVVKDAVLALTALGFSDETASKMVADVLAAEPDLSQAETIIKKALTGGNRK